MQGNLTPLKNAPTNNTGLIRVINHQVSFNKALLAPYSRMGSFRGVARIPRYIVPSLAYVFLVVLQCVLHLFALFVC